MFNWSETLCLTRMHWKAAGNGIKEEHVIVTEASDIIETMFLNPLFLSSLIYIYSISHVKLYIEACEWARRLTYVTYEPMDKKVHRENTLGGKKKRELFNGKYS